MSVVEHTRASCPRCSLPFDGVGPPHRCGDCLAHPPPFSRVASPFVYGGALADAIARFKYGPRPALARPLGKLVAEAVLERAAVDVMIPVPLSRRRLRERGFNQSALLALALVGRLDVPLDTTALERIADSPHQAGLSRAARLTSLVGAFRVAHPGAVKGRRVLLVDDVVTTTATARAASSVLLAAGAAEVTVCCLARTAR